MRRTGLYTLSRLSLAKSSGMTGISPVSCSSSLCATMVSGAPAEAVGGNIAPGRYHLGTAPAPVTGPENKSLHYVRINSGTTCRYLKRGQHRPGRRLNSTLPNILVCGDEVG